MSLYQTLEQDKSTKFNKNSQTIQERRRKKKNQLLQTSRKYFVIPWMNGKTIKGYHL